MNRLETFFSEHNSFALAFSGGVDSAFLLYAAMSFGSDVKAYYVKSAFQPQFELEDALRLAGQLGAPVEVIEVDVLEDEDVRRNPSNRCYYCKKRIFSTIIAHARADGYHTVLDGTNASDDISDRPGYAALQEMSVLSPLRECAMTKADVRALSRQAGLFTWNKPSYACLATRIPSGTPVSEQLLSATEKAEDYLFSLGFSDFRVRLRDGAGVVEVPSSQLQDLVARREEVVSELKKYYSKVYLNLETR